MQRLLPLRERDDDDVAGSIEPATSTQKLTLFSFS